MTIDKEEEPLDPKVEAIRKKMVRLLAVSGGIMMLGLMAVVLAIVYKINQSNQKSVDALVIEGEIALPAGSVITDTAIGSRSIMLTTKSADGKQTLRLYDRNGKLQSTFEIK